MKVILEITDGPGKRRKLWLRERQSMTIGRTQKADFVVGEDAMISGQHFRLDCSPTACQLVDLESTNGTFVNEQRVHEATLGEGDVIRVGSTTFVVSLDRSESRRPPAPAVTRPTDGEPAPRGRPPHDHVPHDHVPGENLPQDHIPPKDLPQEDDPQQPAPVVAQHDSDESNPVDQEPPPSEPLPSPPPPYEPSYRWHEDDSTDEARLTGAPPTPTPRPIPGERSPTNQPSARPPSPSPPRHESDPPPARRPPPSRIRPIERAGPATREQASIGEPDAPRGKAPPPHLAVDPYRPRPEFQAPNRDPRLLEKTEPHEQNGQTSVATIADWKVELYQEFLAGGAFVYSERLAWLADPQLNWRSVEVLEDDLEAYLDGLLIGREEALQVGISLLDEGGLDDPGMANVLTRFFLRSERRDLLDRVLQSVDVTNPAVVTAVSDALRDDFPTHWHEALIKELPHASPKTVQMMTKLVSSRGLEATGDVIRAADTSSIGTLPQLLAALGQLRDYRAHDSLMSCLSTHDDPQVRRTSAIAMLCLGAPHIVGECLLKVKTEEWPLLPLGLGGGSNCVAPLLERAANHPHTDALLALGILGDASAVNVLWSALGIEDFAPAAALALHILTGAELYDEEAAAGVADALSEAQTPGPAMDDADEDSSDVVFDSDNPEEDEPPPEPGLDQPGSLVASCVTHNQVAWQDWWQRHRNRFQKGTRYRMGQPFAPSCLVRQIEAERTPDRIRQLAYQELVIRYNLDFPFDTQVPVERQLQVIRDMDDWLRSYGHRFESGRWYFGGQVMQ